jgi:hypothetical protein
MRALGGVVLLAMLQGCAHTAVRTERPTAVLRVHCNVPVAAVYVDETLVGHAAELGRAGAPVVAGRHRVECRSDGFYSVYREITVAPGQSTLEIFLHPVPEGEPGE